jgi:hypothetical protein
VRRFLFASEAFLFTAAVLADIWMLHFRTHWGDAVPAALAIASFVVHKETPGTLGLAVREFGAALYALRFAGAALVAATAVAIFLVGQPPLYQLYRGCLYLGWCWVQQLLLENMVYRRLRVAFGPAWGTFALTGALFACAHLPNPVLVPATLMWGTVAARLFEHRASVPALALAQTLLSALLYWAAPPALSHQFRVGPGYFR